MNRKLILLAACMTELALGAAAHPTTDWARAELAKWTAAICGEAVEATFALPGEVAGFDDDFAALKGTDGYAVRLRDGRLHFLADAPKGHANAVFGWLERNTDVVWPRPKDELAIYTKKPFAAFAANDYRDVPAFAQRFFGTRLGPQDLQLWRARNRASGCVNVRAYLDKDGKVNKNGAFASQIGTLDAYRNSWGGAHNMVSWWFPHRENPDHPEYYMLVGGKRATSDDCNLCETNPEMVAAFCRSVEEKMKPFPAWVSEVAILMEDTGETCTCANCLKPITLKDGTVVAPDDPAFKSTRFFLFFNQVARHVARVRPGTVLRQYAYVHLSVPPKCEIEPNVKLEWCPYPRNMKESIVEGPSNANWKRRLDGWLAKTKSIYFREYYFCGCIIYPRPITDTIAPDLRYIRDAGVADVYCDAGVAWDTDKGSAPGYNNKQPCCDFFTMCGPEAWTTMRLMWNPDRDPTELRHEFLRRTYRGAAAGMIRFYDLVRESWYSDPMASGWSDSAWRSAAHYLKRKGYEAPCRAALEAAAKAADDPRSANEVRRVRDVFELWMREAPKYMTEEMSVPRLACAEEPGFDLDAGVWRRAAAFPALKQLRMDKKGEWLPDPSGARVKIFSDGRAFWVGFHAKKKPSELVALTGAGQEPFPSGDEMEFLFSSETKGYYQFAFDTKLNRYDAIVYDKSWNGEWTPRVKVVDDGWVAVVRFPFETLGFAPIRNNKIRFLPLVSNYYGGPAKNLVVGWGGGSTAAPESWGELTVDIEEKTEEAAGPRAAENPLVYAPDEILAYAKSLAPRLTEIRREFHRHPEVAWEEVWTTAKIKEILSALPGVEIKPLAMKTGVVAELKGTKPELGTIGLRCDIDALPVPEEKPASHAYKSQIPGKSHACGHDGHMTINLGAAMILSKFRPERTVRFIFQPAEETIPCGAPEMIRAGAVDGLDMIWGFHINATSDFGNVGWYDGIVMAGGYTLDIKVKGKSAHTAYPEYSVNPIAILSRVAVAVDGLKQTIRATRPYSVSLMHMECPNVAHSASPAEGRLVLKTRYHEPEVNDFLVKKIREIVKAQCDLYGATYEIAEEQGLEPTYNLESMGPFARENAAALGLPLEHIFASMGGDDFGFYGWKVPAYYLTFGLRTSPDFPIAHTSKFDFDERVLPSAAAMFASCALRKSYPGLKPKKSESTPPRSR